MPFDGDGREYDLATSVVARLELLQEIAAKQSDGLEGDYRTCLWSRVRKNEALMNAGGKVLAVSNLFGDSCPVDREASAEWFGATTWLWSAGSIEKKRKYIRDRLQVLRETVPA